MNAPEIDGAGAAPTIGDETSAFPHRTFDLARSRLGTGVARDVGRRFAAPAARAAVVELPEMPQPRTAGHPS